MRVFRSCAFAAAAATVFMASYVAAQSTPVSIQFQNGNVTLRTTARMPLRTVLQEWARVGRTKIVNAEGVTGQVDQLELVNVPEQKALAVLLRDISGYAVGARADASSGGAQFDRIMLMPRSTSATVTTGPRVASFPTATQPAPIQYVPGSPDDEANDVPANLAGRGLTPQQIQNNANVAAARAQAAAQQQQQQQQNSDRNPPETAPRAPAAGTGSTVPTNPFYSGRTGRPGEVNPAPQQQRNPLRPNGDPEP
jgi:hypothetical protein